MFLCSSKVASRSSLKGHSILIYQNIHTALTLNYQLCEFHVKTRKLLDQRPAVHGERGRNQNQYTDLVVRPSGYNTEQVLTIISSSQNDCDLESTYYKPFNELMNIASQTERDEELEYSTKAALAGSYCSPPDPIRDPN